MNLKFIGIIAIVLASVIALGCVEEESPIKAPSTQITQESTPVTTPTPSSELNLKVGETAKTTKIEVSVISAQKAKSYNYYSDILKETQTEEASPGKLYVLVDTEIKNVGSDSVFVGYTEFSITDSEGYKYDPTMYLGQDGLEVIKELYQNQKMKGKILFEIPENAKNIKLQYDFGNLFFGTKLASWSIE